jgi:hypothetical protein
MVTSKAAQTQRSREPLNDADTEAVTVGCRHGRPLVCAKNAMPTVCALVRDDGMCLAPPKNWSKRYRRLAEFRDDEK